MKQRLTRRQILQGVGGAAGALLLAGCEPVRTGNVPGAGVKPTNEDAMKEEQNASRMPLVFLPHGGGPWPFIDVSTFGPAGMWANMDRYMRALSMVPPKRPTAVLVVSAHWEESVPTVMASRNPPMLYDYSGFPPEAYEVQWPAPGAPEIAALIRQHLEGAGFRSADDASRGFDHGTFVPLKLGYPDADMPTLQLSLKHGLDPREHLAIGRALAPLRDAGVFIVGSGMSYHNMRGFMRSMRGGPSVLDESRAFDEWLAESMMLEADRRDTRLVEWEQAPQARACHPREEHLLPLMVIAGAAGDDAGTLPYRDVVMGAHVSSVHFG